MSNTTSINWWVGLCGLLTILFIGLKLAGYIGWSWLWVLSPLWIPVVVFLSITIISFLCLMYKVRR